VADPHSLVQSGAGLFITLEGPDGSGKSSLLPRLATVLAAGGCEVVTTREPGSTPLGEQMRRLVLDTDPPIDRGGRADALLFAASRAQHVEEVIRPALARGAVVVCDRYSDSSLAYQGAGSGVPMDGLRAVQQFATGGLVPDLTILLDLPVEVGLRRKSAEITRFEAFQDVAYHERVRAAFLRFAADEPRRYAVVDASAPEAEVLAGAMRAVARVAWRLPCLAAAFESPSVAEDGAPARP
jgi:dTMP kinase